MSPQVSIIVPVYNGEKYLRECLDSILAQTYADFELIVVDDASTDGSRAIADEYKERDRRVRLITMPHNSGQAAARDIGTEHSCGQYVSYVDADDILAPDALQILTDLTERHPHIDIAIGQYSEKPLPAKRRPHSSREVSACEALERTLYQEPLYHQSPWGKLYRREILGNEPFVPGRYYEDFEALGRLYLTSHHVAVTDAVLYYYRQHSGSFIHTWSPKRLDALWAADEVCDYVDRACPGLAAAALSRAFSAYCNIYLLARRAGDSATAYRCLAFIRKHRAAILADRRTRLKNKLGALASSLWH